MWGFLIKFIATCASALCTIITLVQFVLGIANLSDLRVILEKFFNHNKTLSLICIIIIGLFIVGIIFVVQLRLYKRRSKQFRLAGEYLHRFHNDIRGSVK